MANTQAPHRRARGLAIEQLARAQLEARGWIWVAQNVNFRAGEIDLVMRDGATLVFVEVRSRKPSRFGTALESINYSKQRRILAAASLFLASRWRGPVPPCRIDIMTLDGEEWRWYPGAIAAMGA